MNIIFCLIPGFRKSGDKERVFVDSTFGFGYNASTREYKVVRANGLKLTNLFFVLFTHQILWWVMLAIHWFCKEEEEEEEDWFRGAILSFDL